MIFPEGLCPEGNIITEGNISTNSPSGGSIIVNKLSIIPKVKEPTCKNRPLEFRKITEFFHTFCVEEVIHKMNKKR
jgi:hypothetical protein